MTAGTLTIDQKVAGLLAGDPQLLADPFPIWNEVRDTRPVTYVAGAYVLTRHRDVKELLGDNFVLYSRQQSRHSRRYEDARERFSAPARASFDYVMDQEFGQIVRMDPPDHPRVRRVLVPAFAARSLNREMLPKVRARLDAKLDGLAAQGGVVDFKAFAYTFPLEVLGDLLGIPLDDLDQVHEWAHVIAENKLNADSEEAAISADAAYHGLLDYVDGLIRRQRASGQQTGVVAALLEAEAGGQISEFETRQMIALMIFAGHETTSNLLAIGIRELLRNPEQWELLVAAPEERAPAAVEELLRFVTPANFTQYVTAKPVVIDDVELAPGEAVIGVSASANRDPEVFAAPDTLDIGRTDARQHVSLGLGPHFCLGAGLARMEGTMLFESMAQRFPRAQLVDEPIEWGGRSLRTPLSLPLVLEP